MRTLTRQLTGNSGRCLPSAATSITTWRAFSLASNNHKQRITACVSPLALTHYHIAPSSPASSFPSHHHRMYQPYWLPNPRHISTVTTPTNNNNNNNNNNGSSSPSSSSSIGAFGMPGLFRLTDFRHIGDTIRERCEQLRHRYINEPISVNTVRLMDQISNELCRGIDVAELCRSVHPVAAWRDEASRMFDQLVNYMELLNVDSSFFEPIQRVVNDTQLMASMTVEQRLVASQLKIDAERHGIGLPEADRQRLVSLLATISDLSSQFLQGVVSAPDVLRIGPASAFKDVPASVRSRLRIGAGKSGDVHIPADPAIMASICSWVDSAAVREQVYRFSLSHQVRAPNLEVLKKLLAARYELARVMKFPSYGHFFTSGKTLNSPEVVAKFLDDVYDAFLPHAKNEASLLSYAQDQSRAFTGVPLQSRYDVHAWDARYLAGSYKAQKYDLDSRIIAEYFPIDRCIEGMQLIVSKLFGVSLVERSMNAHESWHHTNDGTRVRKFEVVDQSTKTVIGRMYMDIWNRNGKLTGPACFTMRCGRRLATDEDADSESITTHERLINDDGTLGEPCRYQLPVLALVANFEPPSRGNDAPLLTWTDLVVLFHEFGHAMHHILARTELQHLAGTRGVIDWVEVPSHLMEHFLYDYRVVSQFARHYRTNQVIPRDMMERITLSERAFYATDTLTRTFHAAMDQRLHATAPTDLQDSKATAAIVAQCQSKYTLIKPVSNTHMEATFSHIVTYGGGYYTYVYCRYLASAIWQQCFASDPLNRQVGMRYRNEMLRFGGAKDPQLMLRAMLGDRLPTMNDFVANCLPASSTP